MFPNQLGGVRTAKALLPRPSASLIGTASEPSAWTAVNACSPYAPPCSTTVCAAVAEQFARLTVTDVASMLSTKAASCSLSARLSLALPEDCNPDASNDRAAYGRPARRRSRSK